VASFRILSLHLFCRIEENHSLIKDSVEFETSGREVVLLITRLQLQVGHLVYWREHTCFTRVCRKIKFRLPEVMKLAVNYCRLGLVLYVHIQARARAHTHTHTHTHIACARLTFLLLAVVACTVKVL
jgi:hypothetical protein